uniref:Uncharacterized protein MANES_13G070400 n=1 Tax=Rhizophora mucronata TaxID=61149 RepID=A0A2P2MJ32_RHIMU
MAGSHGRDLPLEPFDHRSNGSSLCAETNRRPPIDTMAPPRKGAPEGSNGGGEADGSLLISSGQKGRRGRELRGRRRRESARSRKRR